jgi:hypothetical protein
MRVSCDRPSQRGWAMIASECLVAEKVANMTFAPSASLHRVAPPAGSARAPVFVAPTGVCFGSSGPAGGQRGSVQHSFEDEATL